MIKKTVLILALILSSNAFSEADAIQNHYLDDSDAASNQKAIDNSPQAAVAGITAGKIATEILVAVAKGFGGSILKSWIFGDSSDSPPPGLTADDLQKIQNIVRGEVGNLLQEQRYIELREDIRRLGIRMEDYEYSTYDGGFDRFTLNDANSLSDDVIVDSEFLPTANGGNYWVAGEELALATALRITVKTEMVFRELRPQAMISQISGEMLTKYRNMFSAANSYFNTNHQIECENLHPNGKWLCTITGFGFITPIYRDEYSAYSAAYQYREGKLYETFGGRDNYLSTVSELGKLVGG